MRTNTHSGGFLSHVISSSGDARTAFDARQFLLGWLEKFPQFKNNDFYIAGESYGGEDMPARHELGNCLHVTNMSFTSSHLPAVRCCGVRTAHKACQYTFACCTFS
jgi:hypothetical protein